MYGVLFAAVFAIDWLDRELPGSQVPVEGSPASIPW